MSGIGIRNDPLKFAILDYIIGIDPCSSTDYSEDAVQNMGVTLEQLLAKSLNIYLFLSIYILCTSYCRRLTRCLPKLLIMTVTDPGAPPEDDGEFWLFGYG